MTAGLRYVGVDIGGTKIAAGLVDRRGRVTRHVTCPTPAGSAAILNAATVLIRDLAAGRDVTAIGVGSPGVIDRALGRVISATETIGGWAGTEVAAEISVRTGLPVVVDNDVRAMAYGEARCGAGRPFRDALFVAAGTGIGGAWYRDGRLARGPHGSAGEIAHLLVPSRGSLPCGCGRRDHLEAVAAGPAIAAAYCERAGVDGISLPEVASRMRQGDADARTAVEGAATVLGRALAGLIAACDTAAVVIGGGVAALGDDFLDAVRAALTADALPVLRDVAVRVGELGSSAGVIGAALMARDRRARRDQP